MVQLLTLNLPLSPFVTCYRSNIDVTVVAFLFFACMSGEEEENHKLLYEIGRAIQREVDGQWFLARVQDVDEITRSYQLLYIDDGNLEDEVGA